MTVKDLGPLTWNVPIVDVKSGRPSPEFQRRWNTQRNNNAQIGSITFGSGAPTGIPAIGAEYIDTGVTPYVFYVGSEDAWHQVSAKEFTDLQDTPSSYTSSGNKLVRVNSGASALEFVTPSTLAADPSATGGDVAVDGTASTFMRSDAAPAIQLASSSQFGLVKVDGTTITATGGVISSSGGGGSSFYTDGSGAPPSPSAVGTVYTDTGAAQLYLCDVAGSSGGTSATGWRIYCETNASANFGLAEFGLCTTIGGSSVAIGAGGLPFATTDFGGSFPPANAFDGNNSTIWVANDNTPGELLGYVFGSAQTIVEVYIHSRMGAGRDAPLTAKLQFSNDSTTGFDGTWTDIANLSFATWADDTTQTLNGWGGSPADWLRVSTSVVHTVSTLPASPIQGQRDFVTDATATTFASTVSGGGSDAVPVYFDGTNWCIG